MRDHTYRGHVLLRASWAHDRGHGLLRASASACWRYRAQALKWARQHSFKLKLSMHSIFKLLQLTNLQTPNLSNFEHLKDSNSTAFKLSNFRSLKTSSLQPPKVWNFANFQTLKLSNFQNSWASNFQAPSSQTFELEPDGCSVSLYASPAVLRLAPSCNTRCRGFKLPSWISLQTFNFQTRATFKFETLKLSSSKLFIGQPF